VEFPREGGLVGGAQRRIIKSLSAGEAGWFGITWVGTGDDMEQPTSPENKQNWWRLNTFVVFWVGDCNCGLVCACEALVGYGFRWGQLKNGSLPFPVLLKAWRDFQERISKMGGNGDREALNPIPTWAQENLTQSDRARPAVKRGEKTGREGLGRSVGKEPDGGGGGVFENGEDHSWFGRGGTGWNGIVRHVPAGNDLDQGLGAAWRLRWTLASAVDRAVPTDRGYGQGRLFGGADLIGPP